jgi:large subunit ribosomal protein L15
MGLNNLKVPQGARKNRKRVGRGPGSNWGGTAGRGHKGQLSRSGGKVRIGFEGGQMPLQRRMPKRGFQNYCRQEYVVVNIGDLARFQDNAVVDPVELHKAGMIKHITDMVKVLSSGELNKPLTVKAQGFSKAAKEKIESAGGKVEVIGVIRKNKKSDSVEG